VLEEILCGGEAGKLMNYKIAVGKLKRGSMAEAGGVRKYFYNKRLKNCGFHNVSSEK